MFPFWTSISNIPDTVAVMSYPYLIVLFQKKKLFTVVTEQAFCT